MPRLDGRRGSLLLLALACGASLAVAELGLRAAGIGEPGRGSAWFAGGSHPRFLVQEDPLRGYALRPGFSGHGIAASGEFDVEVVIGEDGRREHRPAAPDRGLRILVVGDSMTFGEGVEAEQSYPARLESRLGVPVANAGVPGYSSRQMAAQVTHYLAPLAPSLVLLTFQPRWDLSSCAAPFVYRDGFLVSAPYNSRLYLVNGNLYSGEIDWPLAGGLLAELQDRTHLARLGIPAARELARRARGLVGAPAEPEPDHGPCLEALSAASAEAGRAGAAFLVVLIESRDDADRTAALRVVAALEERRIPHVALDELLADVPGEALRFEQDAHWNAEGHRQVGESLATAIRERGLVESAASAGTAVANDAFPGMALRARLEAHLAGQAQALRLDPGHQGLVQEVEQADLLLFMRQILFQRDGSDVALGSAYGAESHGGGVLTLILEHWRPGARRARLTDRFFFEANRRSLELLEIQRSHERQIFLPVPGKAPDEIRGTVPVAPQLARMRFRYAKAGQALETLETDAYSMLGLLARLEPDLSRSWVNHLEQRLSAELLLQQAWDRYLAGPENQVQPADHGWLHLPEILLAYQARRAAQASAGSGLDPNRLKRRFLSVELRQTSFEAEDWSETLAHHVESLGLLLSEPAVLWEPAQRRAVKSWLGDLETKRFKDLGGLETDELCHLLKGLRMVEERRAQLQ